MMMSSTQNEIFESILVNTNPNAKFDDLMTFGLEIR